MTNDPIFVDYETRSKCNLPAEGALNYASDSSTEILLVGVAVGDTAPIICRRIGMPTGERPIVSWGRFDYLIYKALENPDFPVRQWIDLSAISLYCGMPAGLDAFSKALFGDTEKKDPRGKQLIKKYCIPRADGDFNHLEGEDLDAMKVYCLQDVALLQKAWKVLGPLVPEWNQYMQKSYETTQIMNDRGVPIDLPAATEARRQCVEHEERLAEECVSICGFKPSQALKIADFLGVESCAKGDLEAITFKDPTQERVRQIRLESAKAATKKLLPMIHMSLRTGRAHGCFLFNGAHTGRGSSRGIQFQNMKRSKIDPAMFGRLHRGERLDEPLREVQESIRGFIHKPGHSLAVADYAQVEARLVAWLAGCKSMLDIFGDESRDIYKEAAASRFGVPPEDVRSEQRSYGKICILGPGYGAGGKALAAQGPGYGITLTEKEGVIIRDFYRDSFPEVPALWDELEAAAIAVVSKRVDKYQAGRCMFTLTPNGKTLRVRLPSGRTLRYLRPTIVESKFGSPQVEYQSRHGRRTIWGGHWLENICQAIATDLKLDAMNRIEVFAMPILEVHDEVVCLVRNDYGRDVLAHMLEVMEDPPDWAPGGLIKAEGDVMDRYSK